VPGSFFLDFQNKQVLVAPEEGQDIKNLKVEYAHREGLMWAAKSLDDIHIIGFNLVHNADWFRARRAISGQGMRWLIENNRVAWASYTGIATGRSNGTIVRNNLVEWCGDAAIGGSGMNLLIEGNKFLHNNWRRINPNFEGGVSKWAVTLDSRIRNNETAYNYGYGLWTDIHNFGNVFDGNICHDDMMGASLFTEISSGDIIRNNVVYNSNTGITIGESPNTLVRHNVVFNNDMGIRMRGNYRRGNAHDWTAANNGGGADTYEKYLASVQSIPGISEIDVDQHMARYLLFWRAPSAHMSNSSYIEENLVFDNTNNYFEHRNYAQPSVIDPFINNFSDYNIWWHTSPANNFRHSSGGYADFAEWQKVSGRDKKSIVANPRDPNTKLPEWAEKHRALWSRKYRSHNEIRDLKLGLPDSPMTAQLIARLRRANAVKPLKLSDSQIRAMQFDVEGRNMVALWTTQVSERRYVRLKTGQSTLVVENGYGGKTERKLVNGTVELVATYIPTYLHNVPEIVVEAPGSTLSARSFNLPGQLVTARAVFVNDTGKPQQLTASFFSAANFKAQPAQVTRRVKAGERVEIPIALQPQGNFVGTGRVSFDAKLGDERILRSATFAMGEGGARLPAARGAIKVDGQLNDWAALGEGAILGSIADVTQVTAGDAKTWKGAADAGAKLYATWTKDAIYAAVAVTDDQVLVTPPGDQPYNNDGVEVFLDGRASDMQWQVQPTEGVYQVVVGAGQKESEPVVQVLSKSELKGLETALSPTANGYVVEIKIPLTAQNFPAADWNAGRAVKMSLLLTDKDDVKAPAREHTLGWSFSPGGRNFQDTSGWKTLVLD
jgi:parallel beta-helix repeat protein